MYLEDLEGFKETLKFFHETLRDGVSSDADYEGEADDLLQSLTRVQEKLKSINDPEQLKNEIGQFGWDFLQVYLAIDEVISMESEEFDLEEEAEEENTSV